MQIQLRDYQRTWCRAVEDALSLGVDGQRFSRVIGTAATGAGKTAMASALCWYRIKKKEQRCLFLAHTDELCAQATRALQRNTGMIADIEKAEERASTHAKLVVGSVMTLANASRRERFPADHFGLVIADECHLSMSDSFQQTLAYFNQGGADVLGITATPERTDKISLMRFYEHLAAEVPLKLLIDRGYLTPIVVQTAPIKIPVTAKISAGPGDMDQVAEQIEPYYQSIIDGIAAYAYDRKRILIFHPSVKASQAFTAMLQARGFDAQHVDGNSPDRAAIIEAFSIGRIRILNNVMLMTAGVDVPEIDCVIMLRPTKSRTMYIQAVGRGTRLYCKHGCHKTGSMCDHSDRKSNVLLLDFLWQFADKHVMGPADIYTDDPEVKAGVKERLTETDEALDLLKLERETIDQSEQRLIRALKEAAQKRPTKYDARSFAAVFHQPDLANYEALAEWQKLPVTDNQVELLKKWRVKKGGIKDRGHASAIIQVGIDRIERKLATPAQVLMLMRFDVPSPETISFDDASRIIDQHMVSFSRTA
jgi:superfamily II DNA or RNA helicase